ncbi:hypothetical protein FEE95_16285 [Maribacter algarum]|uniref:DUF1295 domain-containing protein n=1 Tax=Maribacter algarum (ex Zhang et al. 2020) TaxID=2578118 RepID=A0A5S3PNY3_9FLAO|nr:methyltransferase [Maribacter algarum]TMM56182.1 hypothetical protein FEE95_16285 [Maribacter algarum]
MNNHQPPSLWSGQLLHFAVLILLLPLTWFLWVKIGQPFPVLFWLSIGVPIAHQVFVWIGWRIELKSKAVSNSIGFTNYLIIFFVLLVARPILVLLLAWADGESLGLGLVPRIIVAIALLVPAIYAMYSVNKYFGFIRAAGGDHFDLNYRNMPLVKKCMFKYSGNSMYVFGFLMFWGIAIAFNSSAALLASGFCHVYIWVHYFATEKPDMDYLYGGHQLL